jgi:hypothetical protein
MGCDIHLYVERVHLTKGWVPVDPPGAEHEEPPFNRDGTANPHYSAQPSRTSWSRFIEPESDLKLLADAGQEKADVIPSVANSWSFWRNYSAFARLAGVRSVAGVEPFLPRRPVPADVSAQVLRAGFVREEDWGARWGEAEQTLIREDQTYFFGPDWHDPHWYSLSELREHTRSPYTVTRIVELRDQMNQIAEDYNLPPDEVRAVFWFDN